MSAPALTAAGKRYARALKAADLELDRIAGLLEDAGDSANVLEAARITGVARSTIYRRLYERRNRPIDSTAPAVAPADTDRD